MSEKPKPDWVPQARIPDGADERECYETKTEIIVLGTPDSDDENHNCDALGCGSVGPHVLYRFRKPILPGEESEESKKGLRVEIYEPERPD